MITLGKVDIANFEACIRLKACVEHELFVDSVMYSLAEAWVCGEDMKPFAIYNNQQLIGFVLMYVGEEHYQIINFLVDQEFQGRGYGTAAVSVCLNYLKTHYQAKQVSVPVHTEHQRAIGFWKELGFVMSENVEDGYVFMRVAV